MLDKLDFPVTINIPVPGLGVRAAVEVEQEILDFFGEQTQAGHRIGKPQGEVETPSEWFVSRLRAFVRDDVLSNLEGGADVQTAIARAVINACSYAAPAYYVARALELTDSLEAAGGNALRARLVTYLRHHPVQRGRLADTTHLSAVPAIEKQLRALLAASI